MTHNSEKSRWDKVQLVSSIIGSLAVPVVIAIMGYMINIHLKEKEINIKMIDMSIGILKEDANKFKQVSELREWAIDVLDKHSTIPIPPNLKSKLKTQTFIIQSKELTIGPPICIGEDLKQIPCQ